MYGGSLFYLINIICHFPLFCHAGELSTEQAMLLHTKYMCVLTHTCICVYIIYINTHTHTRTHTYTHKPVERKWYSIFVGSNQDTTLILIQEAAKLHEYVNWWWKKITILNKKQKKQNTKIKTTKYKNKKYQIQK
jgi:hypothetical protein